MLAADLLRARNLRTDGLRDEGNLDACTARHRVSLLRNRQKFALLLLAPSGG